MGTSALKVVTGVLDGKSIRNSITQASHGFSAGMAVRWDIDSAGFTTAIATSPQSAEVSGVIEKITDDDTFMLVYQGEIVLSDFVTGTDNTDEEVYFLSATEAGYLSPTPPTSGGHVIKPLITRRGTVSGSSQQKGLVMNYLGTIIGGEATVSLDGLMPVGTVNAYAGKSSDVPNGWGICDGGTIDAYRYAEYYTRVGWNYGSW
ncbi:TPA: tail fiber protein, partial [Candidatus Woesearchaeota archaeon]|nr:tail fiber protein [Candidatus Woesearchaeota archaeon]